MTDLRIVVEGDEEAARAIARLALFITDLRGFWPLVVPLFVTWMRRQFETEGSFGGAAWAPLAPGYAAWKSEHLGGRGILYAEGDLRQAASRPERRVSPRTLELTVVDPKVRFHQEGTDKMPARPLIFATLPLQAQAELEEAAVVYLGGLVRTLA